MVTIREYNVHVVAGPTASGKTDYAIKLAKKEHGELINIDSRQIYKYLDIGTNKGHLKQRDEVTLSGKQYPVFEIDKSDIYFYLADFLEPDQKFSAFAFRELVYELIPKIVQQGFVPILVGGSGMYLDMIINPERYDRAEDDLDEELRSRLNSSSVSELQTELAELDYTVYSNLNSSDQNNPRRLIRHIEKLTSHKVDREYEPPIKLNVKMHYMNMKMEELTDRINVRVEEMFKQGFVKEVKKVLEKGFSPDSVALTGIGYKQVVAHLNGEISLREAIERTKVDHRRYAKRQITWFNKYLKSD